MSLVRVERFGELGSFPVASSTPGVWPQAGPDPRPLSFSQKHFGQWASGPSVPIIPWSLRGPRELIWEPWAWASRKWGRGHFKHHEKELLDPKD